MTSEGRRQREREAVREKILSAARLLFVREGYEAVSLRKIAEAIEYTAPALYTHFADKAALLRELCRRDWAAHAAAFAAVGDVADPVERLMRAGLAYVRFGLEHPNQYRLMFMTPGPAELEPTAEDLARMGDPEHDSYAFLLKAVGDAIEQKRLRPALDDAHLVAQALWAGVHGVVASTITHQDDPWLDMRAPAARAALVLESMMRGLLRDPSTMPRLKLREALSGVRSGDRAAGTHQPALAEGPAGAREPAPAGPAAHALRAGEVQRAGRGAGGKRS